jgi:hypothetical protein
MDLCKYSNIFGEPNTGLHQYRIFDLAVIDILFTFIAAYILYYVFKYRINYFVIASCLFLLGIIMHRLFCVKTTVDKFLFGQ